jgi:hypothetical protein
VPRAAVQRPVADLRAHLGLASLLTAAGTRELLAAGRRGPAGELAAVPGGGQASRTCRQTQCRHPMRFGCQAAMPRNVLLLGNNLLQQVGCIKRKSIRLSRGLWLNAAGMLASYCSHCSPS